LLNPLTAGPHARFLALRSAEAAKWQRALAAQSVVTDVRADVLRLGLGLYHDAEDVEAFLRIATSL
jgi:selenocysteine lyase/cysteine desulfurase